MQHDPTEGIIAAARVLDALYSKNPPALEPLVTVLRTFAETDEERAMAPDELARTVIDRERIRLRQKPKCATASGHDGVSANV